MEDPITSAALAKLKQAHEKAVGAFNANLDLDPVASLNIVLEQACEGLIALSGIVPSRLIYKGLEDIYARISAGFPRPEPSDEDDVTIYRITALAHAYLDKLVASEVLSDSQDSSNDPLPEKSGMESAHAIAAAWSTKHFPEHPISREGMKTWYKRLRARYVCRQPAHYIWFNPASLRFEYCDNYVHELLVYLPKSRGRPMP